jgi:hypothetical protein
MHPRPAHACTHAPPTHAPTPRSRMHPRPAHACTHAPSTHAPCTRHAHSSSSTHAHTRCTRHVRRTRHTHARHTHDPHRRRVLCGRAFRLEECKQEYQYMRKQFKAPLFEKMLQYGNEFGLCHLTYPSFRCVTSYGNTQLAAADLVSGVAAVLENYDLLDGGNGFAGGAFAAAQKALLSGMRDGLERATREGAMREGIERAKEMLRATVTPPSHAAAHAHTCCAHTRSARTHTHARTHARTHAHAHTRAGTHPPHRRTTVAARRHAPHERHRTSAAARTASVALAP